MTMTRVIRIDDECYAALKEKAQGFEKPNNTIRRLLGLSDNTPQHLDRRRWQAVTTQLGNARGDELFPVGAIVQLGDCSDEQIKWGSNKDPQEFLLRGVPYRVSKVEVHTWHTKIWVAVGDGDVGPFNSVCFEVAS